MTIRVLELPDSYQVRDDHGVHASFSFSKISPMSKSAARCRAEGFVAGYRYALRGGA